MENKIFEDKLILSKEIYDMVLPIKNERKNTEEKKSISSDIIKKRDIINDLKKEKTTKILVMLGQMYNGVIVPQQLSVRRGEFYKYRHHYPLSLNNVKVALLKDLHKVTEKITIEKNLDILEYCLSVWDKDKDNYSNSSYRNRDEDDDKNESFRFDELCIVEEDSYNTDKPNISLDVMVINGVKVSDKGKVSFFYENENDLQIQNLQIENYNELYLKFEDKIKRLSINFIDKLDEEIKMRTNELEKIKLKGSHLLMSAEIQKGTDDMKGYGEN